MTSPVASRGNSTTKPKSATEPPKPSTSTGSGASAKLKTRIVRAELGALRMLKKNARYMAEPEFNRLVENLAP